MLTKQNPYNFLSTNKFFTKCGVISSSFFSTPPIESNTADSTTQTPEPDKHDLLYWQMRRKKSLFLRYRQWWQHHYEQGTPKNNRQLEAQRLSHKAQALCKLVGAIRNNNAVFIFTNQMRHTNGVIFGASQGTTGGMALRFYAAVKIDLRRLKTVKKKNVIIGSHIRAMIKKNKVAPPFRSAEFALYHS